MAKYETASGLLSKMVKFVRNPATNWSQLDSMQTDKDDLLSRQLLKEMIERKRRNDFVRKREFDMLRKLRKREVIVDAGQDTDRPSFFQSSLPSTPDERASTLKKIDEIEAQMSMQWWKIKEHNASGKPKLAALTPDGQTHRTPLLENALPLACRPTAPAGLRPAAPKAADASWAQGQAPTEPAALTMPQAASRSASAPAKAPAKGGLSGRAGAHDSISSGFSPSKASAVDVAEGMTHDAEFEEVAIRFANGDDAGAETGLLEMVRLEDARSGNPECWLTLFDLYRATAQHDKFETAAIQFVERFDRSAPQWFSMPEMVKMIGEQTGRVTHGSTADWVCPSVLGMQTVAALKAALARVPMPWRLDWSHLKAIEAAAVEPLAKLFGGWAEQPVQLRFMGDAQLQTVLQNGTPSGQNDSPQNGWLLRLEALRVTHRPDDFELVALDFCVTFELSPPAWERARCEYKPMGAQGEVMDGQTIIGEVYPDSVVSSPGAIEVDTQFEVPTSQIGNLLSVELSGQIQGDAIALLDKLGVRLMGADLMRISCAKLIRVDFSAAGSLLNWVSAREAENRSVQFSDVNRLVAAFFNVIGITEHASVGVRVD